MCWLLEVEYFVDVLVNVVFGRWTLKSEFGAVTDVSFMKIIIIISAFATSFVVFDGLTFVPQIMRQV